MASSWVVSVITLFHGLAPLTRWPEAVPYPTRPITLIVPFAAGGPTDTPARIIPERMRGGALGRPGLSYFVSKRMRKARKPCISLKPCGTPGGM
jgi:hypothetical protein